MHIRSTNFARTVVWKHEYDVKLWRHKDREPQTNDHHMPLNETPHENFLRTPLSSSIYQLLASRNPCTEDKRIVPQTRAQIRSLYECCSPGHETENLRDRGYFIWEVLHFASDVIKKWVKQIPSEVCLCRISFSNCPVLLAITGGWVWSLSSDTLTVSAVGHSALAQTIMYRFSSLFADDNLSANSFSRCLNKLTARFCNSKNSGFTKPMCYMTTVTMTNSKLSTYFAKPAAFVRVPPVDWQKVSWVILYIVNKTLRELGLDPQRVSESPGKWWNKSLIGVTTRKSVHLWGWQHKVVAALLFLNQPRNKIWFDWTLQKYFVAELQKSLLWQVPHLPQCSYGLDQSWWNSWERVNQLLIELLENFY